MSSDLPGRSAGEPAGEPATQPRSPGDAGGGLQALVPAAVTPATPQALDAAAARLAAGGLVAIPTETVYGLGADACNAQAVASIYSAKGRPADHPLIVHVADARAAAWWAQWPRAAQLLADRFWPGPLTLILPRAPHAPAHACAGQATVGVRCPSHPVAHALLERFHALGGRGVAAPSANRFGRISPTRARHVLDDLGEAAPPILDGGDSPVGIESTIVDLSRGAPVLLRPGAIGPAELEAVLGVPVTVSANVVDPRVVDAAAPKASGTLASHYAPRTPLRIAERAELPQVLEQARAAGARVAACRLAPAAGAGRPVSLAGGEPPPPPALERLAPADPAAYAHALYAMLRELDAAGCDLIVLEAPPRSDDWQAVWDRLSRAATR